jgi:hypothetical protein
LLIFGFVASTESGQPYDHRKISGRVTDARTRDATTGETIATEIKSIHITFQLSALCSGQETTDLVILIFLATQK